MPHNNKLALLFMLAYCTLASPQNLPSSIQAQINSIYPTAVPNGGYGASYFSAHPAAYSTFVSKISSFEAANPTIFDLVSSTASSDFFNPTGVLASQQVPEATGIPNIGLSPTQSAELISAVSEFAAPVTGNPYIYISQHPGAFSSYIAEVSSIIGSDITRLSIPTGAGGGIGGVGGGAGLPTAPIFTMSTSASSRSAASVQSTAASSQITSQTTQPTTPQTTQQQQQQQTASQTATARPSNSGTNGAPLQTPKLVLRFSGVAIAAVAGMAAFL